MRYLLAPLVIALSSCASSAIVPEGPDTYMVYREAGTGFTGAAPLKIQAIKDANKHCADMGKHYVIVSSREIPGGVLGKYPAAEIRFMCLSKGDAELKRPKLEPTADTVVEIRKK